jgi:hypothetical protein
MNNEGLPVVTWSGESCSGHQRERMHSRPMPRRILVTFLVPLLAAMAVCGQTNPVPTNSPVQDSAAQPGPPPSQTNSALDGIHLAEQVRADCIKGRRQICGRILKLLPEGLVVESGYTNLLREPLSSSWLLPSTVAAGQVARFVEGKEPGAMCAGLVFVTDLPKSKPFPPKEYDYVNVQGYPAGQFTYTSVGTIQRTVRKFSAVLVRAVTMNLQTNVAPLSAGPNDPRQPAPR